MHSSNEIKNSNNISVHVEEGHGLIRKKKRIRFSVIASFLFALTLVVTTVFSPFSSVPADAEGSESGGEAGKSDTYTITITDSEKGHSYSAWQIFTGTLTEKTVTENGKDSKKMILSDVKAGSNLKKDSSGTSPNESLVTALKANTALNKKEGIKDLKETATAADIADAIDKADFTAEETASLAKIFNNFKTGEASGKSSKASDTSYEITGLPAGYYLVTDEKSSEAGGETPSGYSSLILQVAGNTEVKPKTSAPQVIKKVLDPEYSGNDSVNLNGQNISLGEGYNDVTDAAGGDEITFEIFATVPDNYDSYDHYYYALEDTMDESLEPEDASPSNDIEMYLPSNVGPNGETAENGIYQKLNDEYFSLEYKNPESDSWTDIVSNEVNTGNSAANLFSYTPDNKPHKRVILLEFNDLKKIDGIKSGAVIKFTYNVVLNAYEKTGSKDGNMNRVKLFYSNNPNNPGSGRGVPEDLGNTPEDINAVFTYGIDVSKISSVKNANGEDKGLAGAVFALSVFGNMDTNEIGDENSPDFEKFYMVLGADEDNLLKNDGAFFQEYIDEFNNKLTSDEKPGYFYPYFREGNQCFSTRDDEGKSIRTCYGTRLITADKDGKFKIKGINAGTYFLEEVKAPDGYNTLMDPIKIVINPTVVNTQNYLNLTKKSTSDTLKESNSEVLTKLEGEVYSRKNANGKYIKDDSVAEIDTLKTTPSDGYVTLKVKNQPGALLPETGGRGTWIYYAAGLLLVTASALFLIMRKKHWVKAGH